MALDPLKQFNKALPVIRKADGLAEQAHMLIAEAYNVLKYEESELTSADKKILEALDGLSEARQQLGYAFYDLQQALHKL